MRRETARVLRISAEEEPWSSTHSSASRHGAKARHVPRDPLPPTAGQIEQTTGVLLAAVFTVIAGAGTVLQLVAFFR
ncbi:hypothetical protein PPMP20_03025 [Paraburkholderia phymatum]|uniref:hypothetical protein n=1 Tax=Paraburkholderia phymatum TaxID=148447 RepID=UPI0012FDA2DA|nr:hypothetical protein [Paraburkholderia phymatum]